MLDYLYDISPNIKKRLFLGLIIIFFGLALAGAIISLVTYSNNVAKGYSMSEEQAVLNDYATTLNQNMYVDSNKVMANKILLINQQAQSFTAIPGTEFDKVVKLAVNYSNLNDSQKNQLLNNVQNSLTLTNADIAAGTSSNVLGIILIIIRLIGLLSSVVVFMKVGLE